MGPEEAYFCSKFFNTLHAIEAPHFNRCTTAPYRAMYVMKYGNVPYHGVP